MQLQLTPDVMGNRDIARKNSTVAEQVLRIEIAKIVIRDNFNVRQDMGDLESLAKSILENGQTIPGRVDVLANGNFVLTDGHRRFKALELLQEQGNAAPLFKAILNHSKTTEEERIFQMFTTQDNKPLEAVEIAELISRLINIGYTQDKVASKIGKTPAYISQMMQFQRESPLIKEEVKNGNLTVSTALKLQKEIPVQSERIAAVQTAVAKKKEETKVKEPTQKAEPKKQAPVTVAEVKGKTLKELKEEKVKEVAGKIMETFDMPHTSETTLINLLNKYL